MSSLTLKDIPDDLLQRLRERARRERRSLRQEVFHLLDVALVPEASADSEEATTRRQLEAWRELAGKWQSDRSIAEETEEVLRARSSGRPVDW